jgi:hypothetical protein
MLREQFLSLAASVQTRSYYHLMLFVLKKTGQLSVFFAVLVLTFSNSNRNHPKLFVNECNINFFYLFFQHNTKLFLN